jgi:hypothetical protein
MMKSRGNILILGSVIVAVLLIIIIALTLSLPNYEAHDRLQAMQAEVEQRQKASTEAQIGLIQYCAQKGGVPIVLYAGTPDVRLSDCKFPFPVQ